MSINVYTNLPPLNLPNPHVPCPVLSQGTITCQISPVLSGQPKLPSHPGAIHLSLPNSPGKILSAALKCCQKLCLGHNVNRGSMVNTPGRWALPTPWGNVEEVFVWCSDWESLSIVPGLSEVRQWSGECCKTGHLMVSQSVDIADYCLVVTILWWINKSSYIKHYHMWYHNIANKYSNFALCILLNNFAIGKVWYNGQILVTGMD